MPAGCEIKKLASLVTACQEVISKWEMQSYYADECKGSSVLKQGRVLFFFYTYTPAVQNMATVPKPPSTLARMATVDSLTVPFGKLEREREREIRMSHFGLS